MKRIYIPPQKGAPKARPAVKADPIDPATPMNYLQFTATLAHTAEEIYTILIRNTLKGFNGTYAEWRTKLQELKDAPA